MESTASRRNSRNGLCLQTFYGTMCASKCVLTITSVTFFPRGASVLQVKQMTCLGLIIDGQHNLITSRVFKRLQDHLTCVTCPRILLA